MKWNLLKIHEFVKDEQCLKEFLRDRKIFRTEFNCRRCGEPMKLDKEGFFRCRRTRTVSNKKRKCDTKVSERKGSWLSNAHLPPGKVLELTYMLVSNFEQKTIAHELEIAPSTVSAWAQHLRQVVVEWSLQASEKIGGVGKVVEIDESKFGRRKYHRGHHVDGQWVFGGVERDSGKVFMVPVESRDSNTLLAIIKDWILPGTTIISDCWRAYNCLASEGYEHLTVNHSLHFKDPVTGAHSNTIESFWRHAKKFLPHYSRRKEFYPAYLAHYMIVRKAKSLGRDLFEFILEEISDLVFDDPDYAQEFPEEVEMDVSNEMDSDVEDDDDDDEDDDEEDNEGIFDF